ncbi:ABC transporter ATP-binding protein [Nocardioides sp. InS609-2]|uniref:ABC transporter ATP-binding protein n=1 Tax=Nocardioides sp. InS609-2 TaxID=2760705 RepID=UPI0020BE21C5|nr:ABC transporter ATP-binding protein [Nocardioides sp. InS609-2]
MTGSDSAVLTIRDLTVSTPAAKEGRPIVAGLDLSLHRGAVHGIAGESGSGKTMTALAILGLLPTGMTATGSITLSSNAGETELVSAPARTLGSIRGRRVAMIFQDPSTSLHPQLSVGRQLTDHVRHHLALSKDEARAKAVALLERVAVPDPLVAMKKFPHQFSGGQRQRIAIAVALACDPEVLLADEPTTALDVTVQAGVLRLLRDMVDESGLSMLFVTHDLGVMSAIADHVSIMRAGVVVESGTRHQVFSAPQHEYTRSLLEALPGSSFEEAPEALVDHLLHEAEQPNEEVS